MNDWKRVCQEAAIIDNPSIVVAGECKVEGNDEHDHDHGHGGEKSSTVSSEVATALVRLLGSMFLCNVSVLYGVFSMDHCQCSTNTSRSR